MLINKADAQYRSVNSSAFYLEIFGKLNNQGQYQTDDGEKYVCDGVCGSVTCYENGTSRCINKGIKRGGAGTASALTAKNVGIVHFQYVLTEQCRNDMRNQSDGGADTENEKHFGVEIKVTRGESLDCDKQVKSDAF